MSKHRRPLSLMTGSSFSASSRLCTLNLGDGETKAGPLCKSSFLLISLDVGHADRQSISFSPKSLSLSHSLSLADAQVFRSTLRNGILLVLTYLLVLLLAGLLDGRRSCKNSLFVRIEVKLSSFNIKYFHRALLASLNLRSFYSVANSKRGN